MLKFAFGVNLSEVLGFYDTSMTGNGKSGYIFTDTCVFYLETLNVPQKLWYADINQVKLINNGKSDRDNHLLFEMKNGSRITLTSNFLNKTPLYDFFSELLQLNNSPKKVDVVTINHKPVDISGAIAGGLATSNYNVVNSTFEEEKLHAYQGHGFAAERANNLVDKIKGHDARIVGDDYLKNGPDRKVDGVFIQSKYYSTGKSSINACFEDNGNGKFRYLLRDGKPMSIEVSSDGYESAVKTMEEKIARGQVDGVTDPAEAKHLVKKGHFTYQQSRNIAKAGTIESLTYDAVNGVVVAASAFGVTAIITFATCVWNGKDFDYSIKVATYSGLKVGGVAFATSVIANQLSKAGLNSLMVGSTESIAALMGPKASAVLINAFRSGNNIYGAAAMRSTAKLLRGNIISAGVSIMVMTSFDVVEIFRGRISGNQLFKNFANTTATVAAGTSGWVAGAYIGSKILPGVGTIVGGLVGSIAAGAVAGKVSNKILSKFIEDDAIEMTRILEKVLGELAVEYLLNQKEAEEIVHLLSQKLDGKLLKNMFESSNKKTFARDLLIPIIESITSKRQVIHEPSDEDKIKELKEILEDEKDDN